MRAIISKHYKVLWYLNPKTGTRSVLNSQLFANAKVIRMEDVAVYHSFFRVSVVRNPFDRVLSCFLNKRKTICKDFDDFDQFVNWLSEGNNVTSDRHFCPQVQLIPPVHLLDKLIRFENLGAGFEDVCRHVGCQSDLPWINTSRHSHYSCYYTKETVRIVSKIYQQDLAVFNFSFETQRSNQEEVSSR